MSRELSACDSDFDLDRGWLFYDPNEEMSLDDKTNLENGVGMLGQWTDAHKSITPFTGSSFRAWNCSMPHVLGDSSGFSSEEENPR
jgi:hypothetical protein